MAMKKKTKTGDGSGDQLLVIPRETVERVMTDMANTSLYLRGVCKRYEATELKPTHKEKLIEVSKLEQAVHRSVNELLDYLS